MGDDGDRLAPPERLATAASWLLTHVATASHRLVLDAFNDAARRTDYAVLSCVEEFEPLSQVELSRRTGIDRGDAVGLLRGLESRGLLARKPDQQDQRRNVVTITQAGRGELQRLDVIVAGVQDRLLDPIPPEDRKTFVELLRRVLHHNGRFDLGS